MWLARDGLLTRRSIKERNDLAPTALGDTTIVIVISSRALSSNDGVAQIAVTPPGQQTTEDPSELAPAKSTLKGAIAGSVRLLLLEHSMRVAFQQKTRRELGGRFFGDYFRSVRMPQTWDDSDRWGVIYLGHPIHGAASEFIWLDHEDGARQRSAPNQGFWKGVVGQVLRCNEKPTSREGGGSVNLLPFERAALTNFVRSDIYE